MGDRERWDSRHAAARREALAPPEPFVLDVLEALGEAEGRRALDLAAGAGRHALELSRRGYRVEAWDLSPVALEDLARRAGNEGLVLATRVIDLSGGVAGGDAHRSFDLVLAVNFLDRALLAQIHRLVVLGGCVVVSTFTVDRPGEHPRSEWCLQRGELARGLPGLETIRVEEVAGRASLLGRAVERRGPAPT